MNSRSPELNPWMVSMIRSPRALLAKLLGSSEIKLNRFLLPFGLRGTSGGNLDAAAHNSRATDATVALQVPTSSSMKLESISSIGGEDPWDTFAVVRKKVTNCCLSAVNRLCALLCASFVWPAMERDRQILIMRTRYSMTMNCELVLVPRAFSTGTAIVVRAGLCSTLELNPAQS